VTARRLLTITGVIKEAVNEFLSDNCPHLAAAISFFLLLSLFPLVLAAVSIVGLVSQEPDAANTVTDAITDFLPAVSADFVDNTIDSVRNNWVAAGIIATVGLLWAGMAVFNAVRKSLNAAWGIKQPRPFLHERLLEFLMLIIFGGLLLISLGMTTAFKVIRDADLAVLQSFTDGGLLWQSVVIMISVFITFLGFLFLYKLVPNTTVSWRHAAIGALAAAALFEIVKNLFTGFVGDFARYNIVYGPVSIVITLMVWAYISAVIMLFCAKLTSVYPKVKAAIAAEKLAVELAEEEQRSLVPSVMINFSNMSSLTLSSIGALRRLMLGKS